MRTRTAAETAQRLGWSLALDASALPAQGADSRAPRFVRVQVDIANLRARPAAPAEQIRSAYENEPLRVVGRQGWWLEMRDVVAGEALWIDTPLTDSRPTVVVVRDVVNVRARPGTGHPTAFTAERGVNLLVLERAGRWLRVQHDVGEGCLHDSLVWGSP